MPLSPPAAVFVWGTQLNAQFNSALAQAPAAPVIMIESPAICRRFAWHKLKLVLVLSAMRAFADELRGGGRQVHYTPLEDSRHNSLFGQLGMELDRLGCTELVVMAQNDRPPQAALERWCARRNIKLTVTPNRLFLTRANDFAGWAAGRRSLLMESFYHWQRRRFHVLLDEAGQPAGRRWNFDHDNRQPLPRDHQLPALLPIEPTNHVRTVQTLVDRLFPLHPGSTSDFWLPASRGQALAWLQDFITHRLANFGRYEDAMRAGEPVLYHSVLSPLINLGLLHPREVLASVEQAYRAGQVPLNSAEGLVRQVLGWREFMFSMYHYQAADWKTSNQLQQTKPLEDWWYGGAVDEVPLRDCLQRVIRYGYTHHIERLMVLGNYMLIGGYSPQAAYDWFMEMFVDAYEWVMVPNVIGMSQYADGGGSFATKPYISGANYLQKMGHWWPGPAAMRASAYTPLYWEFLHRHKERLAGNPRMSLVLRQLDRHD